MLTTLPFGLNLFEQIGLGFFQVMKELNRHLQRLRDFSVVSLIANGDNLINETIAVSQRSD